jgi:hypothetical protein
MFRNYVHNNRYVCVIACKIAQILYMLLCKVQRWKEDLCQETNVKLIKCLLHESYATWFLVTYLLHCRQVPSARESVGPELGPPGSHGCRWGRRRQRHRQLQRQQPLSRIIPQRIPARSAAPADHFLSVHGGAGGGRGRQAECLRLVTITWNVLLWKGTGSHQASGEQSNNNIQCFHI